MKNSFILHGKRNVFFFLTLMPNSYVWGDGWMISHWTHIYKDGQEWHTESIWSHVSSTSTPDPPSGSLFSKSPAVDTGHVMSSTLLPDEGREKKKTSNGKCQCRVLSESSSYTPSVLSTPSVSASHIMIQSGSNIYLDLNGAVISRNVLF